MKHFYEMFYKFYFVKLYRYDFDWKWTDVDSGYDEIEIILIRRKK